MESLDSIVANLPEKRLSNEFPDFLPLVEQQRKPFDDCFLSEEYAKTRRETLELTYLKSKVKFSGEEGWTTDFQADIAGANLFYKRVANFLDTGFGKTFTAVMTKFEIDKVLEHNKTFLQSKIDILKGKYDLKAHQDHHARLKKTCQHIEQVYSAIRDFSNDILYLQMVRGIQKSSQETIKDIQERSKDTPIDELHGLLFDFANKAGLEDIELKSDVLSSVIKAYSATQTWLLESAQEEYQKLGGKGRKSPEQKHRRQELFQKIKIYEQRVEDTTLRDLLKQDKLSSKDLQTISDTLGIGVVNWYVEQFPTIKEFEEIDELNRIVDNPTDYDISLLRREKKALPNATALVVSPISGMQNAWHEDEINRYAKIYFTREQRVLTISDFKDLDNASGHYDFVVVNWDKLSKRAEDKNWKKLHEFVKKIKPAYQIFDEVDTGGGKLRKQRLMDIVDLGKDWYAAGMTATPGDEPNKLGVPLHVLDPKQFQDMHASARQSINNLRTIWDNAVCYRLTREEAKDILGLPDWEEKLVYVQLSRQEEDLYVQLSNQIVPLGKKYNNLYRALAFPDSVPGTPRNIPCSKAQKIVELAQDSLRKGHKAVVYSRLVPGVITSIEDALYEDGVGESNSLEKMFLEIGLKPLIVTGNTSVPDRKRIYEEFTKDPSKKLLVSSFVSIESIALVVGKTPLDIFGLMPTPSARQEHQIKGRFIRRKQEGKVTFYQVFAQSEFVKQRIIEHAKELREEYEDLEIPKNLNPELVDICLYHICKKKEREINNIFDNKRVDLAILKLNEFTAYKGCKIIHLDQKKVSPFALATAQQTEWVEDGEDKWKKRVTDTEGKTWEENYEAGWHGSASQYAQELVAANINQLRNGHTVAIGDLACGAAYLSRVMKEGMDCIDISENFLAIGKSNCDALGINNNYIVGSALDTTVASHSYDILTNVFMLMYLKQNKEKREMSNHMLEANRIVKPDGHYIVVVPHSAGSTRNIKAWSEEARPYGFEVVQYQTPKETKGKKCLRKGAHIITFQKKEEVREIHDGFTEGELSLYRTKIRYIH